MQGIEFCRISIGCSDRIDPFIESYYFHSLQCLIHLSFLPMVHFPTPFTPYHPTIPHTDPRAIKPSCTSSSFLYDSNKHHFTKEFLLNIPTLLLLLFSGGSDLRMNQSACVIQQLLQLSRLVQISHDIASTNKISLNKQLRERRPVPILAKRPQSPTNTSSDSPAPTDL